MRRRPYDINGATFIVL